MRLALALATSGRIDDAEVHAEEALRLAPEEIRAHLRSFRHRFEVSVAAILSHIRRVLAPRPARFFVVASSSAVAMTVSIFVFSFVPGTTPK